MLNKHNCTHTGGSSTLLIKTNTRRRRQQPRAMTLFHWHVRRRDRRLAGSGNYQKETVLLCLSLSIAPLIGLWWDNIAGNLSTTTTTSTIKWGEDERKKQASNNNNKIYQVFASCSQQQRIKSRRRSQRVGIFKELFMRLSLAGGGCCCCCCSCWGRQSTYR